MTSRPTLSDGMQHAADSSRINISTVHSAEKIEQCQARCRVSVKLVITPLHDDGIQSSFGVSDSTLADHCTFSKLYLLIYLLTYLLTLSSVTITWLNFQYKANRLADGSSILERM